MCYVNLNNICEFKRFKVLDKGVKVRIRSLIEDDFPGKLKIGMEGVISSHERMPNNSFIYTVMFDGFSESFLEVELEEIK
jgi:hypothetical protein